MRDHFGARDGGSDDETRLKPGLLRTPGSLTVSACPVRDGSRLLGTFSFGSRDGRVYEKINTEPVNSEDGQLYRFCLRLDTEA